MDTQQQKSWKVLLLGDSCLDVYHYGVCERMSPEAPVPVFNSSKIVKNGGMAMNVYNNLSSLGSNVEIYTNTNWKNITKTRFVDKRTNHMFMRLDEHDDEYGKIDLQNLDLQQYDAVIVSDYNKGFMSESDINYISKNSKLIFHNKEDVKLCKKKVEYVLSDIDVEDLVG